MNVRASSSVIVCLGGSPDCRAWRPSLMSDTRGWRAPASVDSHRSGTMVYEEKSRSGIDTPEVHR